MSSLTLTVLNLGPAGGRYRDIDAGARFWSSDFPRLRPREIEEILYALQDQRNVDTIAGSYRTALDVLDVSGIPTRSERTHACAAGYIAESERLTVPCALERFPDVLTDTLQTAFVASENADIAARIAELRDQARARLKACQEGEHVDALTPDLVEGARKRRRGLPLAFGAWTVAALAGWSFSVSSSLPALIMLIAAGVLAVCCSATPLWRRTAVTSWQRTSERLTELALARPLSEQLETQVVLYEITTKYAGIGDPEARAEAEARAIHAKLIEQQDTPA